jgi:dTDP-4-amino-4,6-dideoxygalactose transaminase
MEFSNYIGTKHVIGCANGLDALRLILRGYIEMGIMHEGDEIIAPANTFIATLLAITENQLRPVLVEPNLNTYNISIEKIEQAITKKTKAIMIVHLYGRTVWDEELELLSKKYNLKIIEDCAQAIGAINGEKRSGSIGNAAGHSFYPGKNLGALGEAGAIVTNDLELADKIRVLRDHGQTRKYHHTVVGWNCRMDAIQGACLAIKLRHLDRGNELRRTHAARYNRAFKEVEEIIPPLEAEYARHVYHVYAIRVRDRDEVMRQLEKKGIGCGVHYPVPVHLQQAYASLGHRPGAFPVSEQIANEFLSLPMFPELTEAQIEFVIESVTETVSAGAIA